LGLFQIYEQHKDLKNATGSSGEAVLLRGHEEIWDPETCSEDYWLPNKQELWSPIRMQAKPRPRAANENQNAANGSHGTETNQKQYKNVTGMF
jgi:hypothetical protein